LDIKATVCLDAFNGSRVGAAFVDGDVLWQIVQVDSPLQKAPRSSQIKLGREKSTVSPSRSTARYRYFRLKVCNGAGCTSAMQRLLPIVGGGFPPAFSCHQISTLQTTAGGQ
jgi:hypothetical protein